MMNQGIAVSPNLILTANTPSVLLHIGNLDKEVTEDRLRDLFGRYCKNVSVKIVRDMNGSKGFGFVYVATQADAEIIRQTLNHEKVGRKEITISFNKRPDSVVDQNANLIIKNLDPQVTGREFERFCSEFGKVVSCKVKDDEHGNSLGYGYVQFEKEANALECIAKISTKPLSGRVLQAEKFVPRSKRPTANQQSNLYIKQFPDKMTKEEIEKFIDDKFSKFGKIASKGVHVDPKINKIYSFVAFEDAEAAKEALKALNDFEFPGSSDKLYVDFAQTKFQRKQLLEKNSRQANETNIYMKSLKEGTRESDLERVFSKYGPITSKRVTEREVSGLVGSEKKILGSAFINFANGSDAKRAISEGKNDPDVLALLDPCHNRSIEFLHFHQPKDVRAQYIKTTKRNLRAADNLTFENMPKQMMELFKMFMLMQQNNKSNPAKTNRNEQGGYQNKRSNRNQQNTIQQVQAPIFPNVTLFDNR